MPMSHTCWHVASMSVCCCISTLSSPVILPQISSRKAGGVMQQFWAEQDCTWGGSSSAFSTTMSFSAAPFAAEPSPSFSAPEASPAFLRLRASFLCSRETSCSCDLATPSSALSQARSAAIMAVHLQSLQQCPSLQRHLRQSLQRSFQPLKHHQLSSACMPLPCAPARPAASANHIISPAQL